MRAHSRVAHGLSICLSGLAKSGQCGGGMSNAGDDRLGCANARDRGIDAILRGIPAERIRERVTRLEALDRC
jgi:hypothetical protein